MNPWKRLGSLNLALFNDAAPGLFPRLNECLEGPRTMKNGERIQYIRPGYIDGEVFVTIASVRDMNTCYVLTSRKVTWASMRKIKFVSDGVKCVHGSNRRARPRR